MRGYCLFAIKDWQKLHNKPVAAISEMSPGQRLNATKEMFGLLKELLKGSTSDAQSNLVIDKSLASAFEFYKENYASR